MSTKTNFKQVLLNFSPFNFEEERKKNVLNKIFEKMPNYDTKDFEFEESDEDDLLSLECLRYKS